MEHDETEKPEVTKKWNFHCTDTDGPERNANKWLHKAE